MKNLKVLARRLTIINGRGDEHVITSSIISLYLTEKSHHILNISISGSFKIPIDHYELSKYQSESPFVLYADLALYIYQIKGQQYLSTSKFIEAEY